MSNTAPTTEPDTGLHTASDTELILRMPTPTTLHFLGTIFLPRSPTNKEMLEIKEDWKKGKLGTSLNFLVMGKETEIYDCFQWAVQEYFVDAWGLEETDYNDYQTAIRMLNKLGYELTSNAFEATIDVWGILSADGEVTKVTHFSLLTEFGWTSKLGNNLLIVHDRYDLEPLDYEDSDNAHYDGSNKEDYGSFEEAANVASDDQANVASAEEVYDGSDEDEPTYGYVVAHFKRKEATPLQQYSIREVCMMARCDHADCDFIDKGCKLKWPPGLH